MKNNLEDQLKDAFDHFEPEVDSSVWTKISSQLPAAPSPLQPANVPSGPLASIGSAGSWIAAAAVTVIAGAGLYFVLNQSPETKPETLQPVPVSTETPVPENISINSSENEQTETASSPAPVTEKEEVMNQSTVRPEEDITASQAPSASAYNQQNTEPVSSVVNQAASPATSQTKTENNSQASHSTPAEISNNSVQPSDAVKTPLRIIINTTGGFAPLSITAMSNQPDKKAVFEFGDGYSTSAESATHTYKEAGLYHITCTYSGQDAGQDVEVLEALPTAFSPNGDGANDLYTVSSMDIREAELRIYTRNGRLAFSGKGDSVSWNGAYPDGRPAETGTYFYDIFVTSARGNIYKQKGTLTLFR